NKIMHRLLEQQVKAATRPDGQLDVARLLAAVEGVYRKIDEERRGVVRSMQLLSDEATALTRELRETTASQLQAVLDHVKDAILTVDGAGHIATINATGQRIFGFVEPEVVGRPLSFLLPQLGAKNSLAAELEQLAARQDDTQVDLSPHETLGRRAGGGTFPAEIAVSKMRINRDVDFVVCLRDTGERKSAEAALRDSEARYRRLFENVMEGVYSSTCQGRFLSVNPALARMVGLDSPDELLSLPTEAIYDDPAERAAIIAVLERDGE